MPNEGQTSALPQAAAMPPVKPLVSWQAYEYPLLQNTPWTKIFIVLIFTLPISSFLALQQNYIGGGAFLVAALIAFLSLLKKPRLIRAAIFPDAVVCQGKRYLLSSFESFAILRENFLFLYSKKGGVTLRIPLDIAHEDGIRHAFIGRLEEKTYESTFTDIVNNFFRM